MPDHHSSRPKSFASGPPIFNPPPRGADTAELAEALDADLAALEGRELGTALTRMAVARYRAVERLVDDAARRTGDHPAADKWVSLAIDLETTAAEVLLRAILAWGDVDDWGHAEKTAHPPRGVIEGGRLYLAIRSPDDETPLGGKRKDGVDVMRLAVVDLDNVMVLGSKGGASC